MYPVQTITVIIADDHEIFRQGFKSIIANQKNTNIKFIGEASNGLELVEKAKKHQPNVVITDIKMPVMDGLQACRIIRKECPATRVIALSQYEDVNFIMEMTVAGASGYLTKTDLKEIIKAIKTVSEGFTYFKKAMPSGINKSSLTKTKNEKELVKIEFSLTEVKIIHLICGQLTTKEIAATLNLGKRTIEDYRHKIQKKMKVKNAAGIVAYAFLHGIEKLGLL